MEQIHEDAMRVMDRMIKLALLDLDGKRITNELLQEAMNKSFLVCENNPFKDRAELTQYHSEALDNMEAAARKRFEERRMTRGRIEEELVSLNFAKADEDTWRGGDVLITFWENTVTMKVLPARVEKTVSIADYKDFALLQKQYLADVDTAIFFCNCAMKNLQIFNSAVGTANEEV